MKILQVNSFHYPRGGSDRYFLEISKLLRDNGHEVRTFSTARPENVKEDLLIIHPPAGVETERAKSILNLINFLYSFDARRKMLKALEQFKPDIVHLHIYFGQLTASILAPLRNARIPIVQTLHEYKLVCPTHGLYANGHFCDACHGRHYWRSVMQRCNRGSLARSLLSMSEAYLSDALGAKTAVNKFIAVSDFQRRQLIRLGVPKDKLSVLHHFTDISPGPPQNPGRYFLFVGRLINDKGIGILLDAYARLGKESLPLKIVGTGAGITYWRKHANKLGLKDRVEWLGFKTGEELMNIYRDCIALINPSLLNETFGLTCLEALALGRPVIASGVGAIPEVISDWEDGILVEPGSINALAEAMRKIGSEPGMALSMGRRGWGRARLQFSNQRHYQGLLKIYEEVIG